MVSFSFANVPPGRTTEASKKFVDKALPEVALVPAANEPEEAARGPVSEKPLELTAKPLALLREVLVKPLDLTPAALGARAQRALDEAEGEQLVLVRSSSRTGYKGVYTDSN